MSKQIKQVEQNLNLACDAVSNIMIQDNYDEKKRGAILSAIKILLNSEDYVKMLMDQTNKILKDKKIDSNDYADLFIIVVQSNDFMSKVMQNSSVVISDFNIDSMQYIVFAAIYFGLVSCNADQQTISGLVLVFPSLWKLVKIDPKKLVSGYKSIFGKIFKCCR